MLTFAYFPGCKIAYHLPAYDVATRAVLAAFDIALWDTPMNCCGYPVRHRSFEAAVFSAARVMALAGRRGLPLLTPCMCCYGQLKLADHWLGKHPPLAESVNRLLAAEDLRWEAGIGVRHLLAVLHDDIGPAAIRSRVRRPLKSLKVAAHYGCHGLRPARVVQFDNPLAPRRFEALIAATGAEPVAWSERVSCCGNPLWGKIDALAVHMMRRRLASADGAGADRLCTGCTYCHLQFAPIRRMALPAVPRPAAVLFPHLLGESLGLDSQVLGIGLPERAPASDGRKS
jgi:heterodisulfide reductase subunit B